jgi:hypothetical protein
MITKLTNLLKQLEPTDADRIQITDELLDKCVFCFSDGQQECSLHPSAPCIVHATLISDHLFHIPASCSSTG